MYACPHTWKNARSLKVMFFCIYLILMDSFQRVYTFPVRDTSPVMAIFCRTGLSMARESNAVMMVQPADGPSFGVAP